MNKIKVLHIVGGSQKNGSFKGAEILHQALLKQNVNSKILNDGHTNTHMKYQISLLAQLMIIFFNIKIKYLLR